jgi:hypothetical protein
VVDARLRGVLIGDFGGVQNLGSGTLMKMALRQANYHFGTIDGSQAI